MNADAIGAHIRRIQHVNESVNAPLHETNNGLLCRFDETDIGVLDTSQSSIHKTNLDLLGRQDIPHTNLDSARIRAPKRSPELRLQHICDDE